MTSIGARIPPTLLALMLPRARFSTDARRGATTIGRI